MNVVVKGGKNQSSKKCKKKKVIKKTLKHFTNHEKKLSSCLMVIPKLYLKLNTKQDIEKDSKY